MSDENNNWSAADWAMRNITHPVVVKPLFSSRLGAIIKVLLCFCVSGAFILLGIVSFLLGSRDQYAVGRSLFFGVLLLIPSGLIYLLGFYVRAYFVRSLDGLGVKGSRGQHFSWGQLRCVDHVTKHVRVGRVTRRIRDNQIELVFTGGRLVIPPLIHNRAEIWALINAMPVEVRDDGVVRTRPNIEKDFMEFLERN